jgi:glycosyltransferase involved in cell wall biosynthesis
MTMGPVKIAYLMDHYAHPYGGTERQVLELIRRLDRRRFQPQVAVFRASEYLKHNEFDCAVDVLAIKKMASATTLGRLYRYARELRKRDFSIVHIFFNDASVVAPPILKWQGLKVVVSRRDMGFWCSARTALLLKANRLFVDRVVANSEAVKRSVQAREGYSDSKISVIYNGHDRASETTDVARRRVRDTLGIGPEGVIVGIVANLRTIKRIEDLIRAFALVRRTHHNAWLVIVGTGDLRNKLEDLATSLDIRSQVVFTGQLSDPLPVIHEFAVGVICSESEGFSNSIIEYMYCAKPTVCTNVGGNPEIVRDGENGFLVPVGDVGKLAERLERLLGDPALAQRLGRNALVWASERYDMGRMIEAHMELYERMLSGDVAARGGRRGRYPTHRTDQQ